MKIAIVTGSARGIGRGIGNLLSENGYKVIFSDIHPTRPEDLEPEKDYFPCDISNSEQRKAIVDYAISTYGRLDALVNNAGVAPLVRKDIMEMEEASFDRVLGINLKGTFFLCQQAANAMVKVKENGPEDYAPRIVNIGSISAYTSSTARGEYCMSKAGVAMVTQLFADRLAEYNIPVFEVRPGIIATDMTKTVHEKYQNLIDGGLLPIKRFGKPEDVAKMVLACCSGLLDYTSGQILNADGGFHLRRL